jgi:hypothetical protein
VRRKVGSRLDPVIVRWAMQLFVGKLINGGEAGARPRVKAQRYCAAKQ